MDQEVGQLPESVVSNTVSSGVIIPSSQGGGDRWKKFFNWGVVLGVFVIVLGGAGSIIFTLNQSISNVGRATKQRDEAIRELLEDSSPQTSFSLLSKVEARDNPLSTQNTYTNPFTKTPNPFDEIEP